MNTYADFRTLGSNQLCTFLIADGSVIISSCHYYLVSTLFQNIFQKKGYIQVQLIFRKAAVGTSGSGRSFCLHGGGTGTIWFGGTHINVFTLMSRINSYDVAICG